MFARFFSQCSRLFFTHVHRLHQVTPGHYQTISLTSSVINIFFPGIQYRSNFISAVITSKQSAVLKRKFSHHSFLSWEGCALNGPNPTWHARTG